MKKLNSMKITLLLIIILITIIFSIVVIFFGQQINLYISSSDDEEGACIFVCVDRAGSPGYIVCPAVNAQDI